MRSIDHPIYHSPSLPDADQQLRIHLLWYLFARVIVFTLLLGITVFFQTKVHRLILPPPPIIIGFISIIYIYSIGSAAILQKVNLRLKRFGAYQVTLDCLAAAFLVYATGCSQSIFTPVFILPIIAGGLILYKIGGLIPATAATILYAIVLILEFLGQLPDYYFVSNYNMLRDPLASMNIFSVYGLIFFLGGMLSGLLGTRLRTAEDALSVTSRQLDRLSSLYQQIFNDISTGIITVDAGDTITSCNPAAEAITGYKRDEIIGHRLGLKFPGMFGMNKGRRVGDLQKKDGELTRVVYSFSTLKVGDKAKQNSWKIITFEDISKIEEMEKQIMEARNKAVLGELSANIAHDFRNPLAAIYGSAQIISLELDSTASQNQETQKRLISIILRESERMANTITEFLQFARPRPVQLQWSNIKRTTRETISRLETSGLLNGHEIHLDMEENIDVWSDGQQLQAVMHHLLLNAIHASAQSPHPIHVRAREEKKDDANFIRIEISDHGKGIAPELMEKIFDPFFSTYEDGTGLGLAIVKQIIGIHQGSVEVLSEVGKGTTVSLLFPLPETPTP